MLLHTDAFAHKRFYAQTLLHTDAFKGKRCYTQTLLHTSKSLIFAFTFRPSILISCERAAPGPSESQFYHSFLRSALIQNRNFGAVFEARSSFRAKALRAARQNHMFFQFLTLHPHFVVRKRATRQNRNFPTISWRSTFISCERLAFRDRSWPPPPPEERREIKN